MGSTDKRTLAYEILIPTNEPWLHHNALFLLLCFKSESWATIKWYRGRRRVANELNDWGTFWALVAQSSLICLQVQAHTWPYLRLMQDQLVSLLGQYFSMVLNTPSEFIMSHWMVRHLQLSYNPTAKTQPLTYPQKIQWWQSSVVFSWKIKLLRETQLLHRPQLVLNRPYYLQKYHSITASIVFCGFKWVFVVGQLQVQACMV